MTRRNLRLMAVAWCIFLPLFLVAFTGTPAQPSPRRRPRARRVTGGEGAIGPTGTTRASSTAERALVPPMSGTSITARAFTRRAATGMVVVALAVAALVYPVSLTVTAACVGVVTSGYDHVLSLRFIFLFVLLPTVILGLTADLFRAIARQRRGARHGTRPRPSSPVPDLS